MATQPLEPKDWEDLRRDLHGLLDRCVDQMRDAEDHPWQTPPPDLADRYAIGSGGDVVARVMDQVLPYHGGNTHPKFWGWVQGSGLASDLVAGIAAAVMNTNGGGRHHGINEMERAVIDWTRRKMGFDDGASGVLVAGTSQATVIALQTARVRCCPDARTDGGNTGLTVYAAEGVHNATRKAVELLGLGHEQLRLVRAKNGTIDLHALQQAIVADRASGLTPMAIVGTAGSVDLGGYDDLNGLADLTAAEGIWLHVDGAFGAWTRLADSPWRGLTDGIERADSIALDFHKWMYVGYDCGLALIADQAAHRAAFAARPSYLKGAAEGLAGGEPWFCDYGIDLSRGNRALKVWCALEMFGEEAFAAAITLNCKQAAFMADQVQARGMALAAPVVSNICVFTAAPDLPADQQSALNAQIATHLQLHHATVFSTTDVNGITCLRAAITNHRTRDHHVEQAMQAVVDTAGMLRGVIG
ncbi:Glutamate or tyrosine decarboxylase [Aliiroseovarius halocynthiae]|uniref:Amino acid decarboxylase n=1 Tax=Aliiroseovarius halocynthiae TaxID=985055 RepID=A0A545STP9_9RHOB|nr:pyridoxal-dependent decarboxylase [Aliiroseovarius halocynthiae]TQV68346.1 amino acid decarboxylase [Aliiroseovarius halocynthiae]SMR70728.1 Glutamate or tyrosine decarboxylase [Aliiroseovarius halocynthiae]